MRRSSPRGGTSRPTSSMSSWRTSVGARSVTVKVTRTASRPVRVTVVSTAASRQPRL
jgi:hypothetical protein